jgi:hypothetical protein
MQGWTEQVTPDPGLVNRKRAARSLRAGDDAVTEVTNDLACAPIQSGPLEIDPPTVPAIGDGFTPVR